MSYNTRGGSAAKTSTGNKPALEVRVGKVKVVGWLNETPSGAEVLNCRVRRIYKGDDEEWKETDSFGLHDLLHVAEVLRLAWHEGHGLK